MDKKEIKPPTSHQLFLIVQLLKELREITDNPEGRHNLLVKKRAYDKLLTRGPAHIIDELRTKIKKARGKNER